MGKNQPDDFESTIRHNISHDPTALKEVEGMYKRHLEAQHAMPTPDAERKIG